MSTEGVFADELIFDELIFDVGDGVGEHPPLGGVPSGRKIKGTHEYADPGSYLRAWAFYEARIKLAGERAAERARAAALADSEYVKWQAATAAQEKAVFQARLDKILSAEKGGVMDTKALTSMSNQDFAIYQAWKKGLH
jgi:hypothetical protein